MTTRSTARKPSTYHEALNLSWLQLPLVIVAAGKKGPTTKGWPNKRYSEREICRRFKNNPDLNIGLRLGPASGIIDIEGDHPDSEEFIKGIFAEIPRTPTYKSSRGIHRFFKYNERLADLPTVVKLGPNGEMEARIGAGDKAAQSLLPPSTTDGFTREWIIRWDKDCQPAPLPDHVVDAIIEAAKPKPKSKYTAGGSVGDDYCQKADWHDILAPRGWEYLGTNGDVSQWKRPGKESGVSATIGLKSEAGYELLYCFTSNAQPLEQNQAYNKFAVYTLLNHDGDFKAAAAALKEKGYGPQGRPSASTKMLKLVSDCELFHTPGGDPYAGVPVGKHRETYPVEGKQFKQWLAHRYYRQTKSAPSTMALSEAVNVVAAQARFDGPEIPVYTRLAESNGAIYHDLADEHWRAVEITREGVDVVDEPPVKFRRPNGLLKLPHPEAEGTIDELRPYVNVTDESWALLVAGICAALRPSGPYPILLFTADHGSCKSTTMRVVRELIDPNTANLRSTPKDVQGLMLQAHNSWLCAFDNLSTVPPWLADALCRLATGGGLGTRKLYENDEEQLFDAQRPVMVTAITDLTDRQDFLDRCLFIHCPPMTDDRRRDESELSAAWAKARPRVLWAFLRAVSVGLRNLPDTQPERLPRMADFARWMTAIEPALWEPGTFSRRYDANRAEARDIALDNPVGHAVKRMLSDDGLSHVVAGDDYGKHNGRWRGTATQLLTLLTDHYSTEQARASDDWPRNARALTAKLNRMRPNLRDDGIEYESRHRIITITKA